jgi:hypothetical protein
MGICDIAKLNELNRGMSQSEVRQILGKPKQKELKAGKTILKYSLHQWFRGWKPVYLVFDERNQLTEWFVDEKEFMDNQKLWMNAFKFWKQ